MHDEVRLVADSPRLSALTAKTVGKALQLMAEKVEYMTFAGRHLTSSCTQHPWLEGAILLPAKTMYMVLSNAFLC